MTREQMQDFARAWIEAWNRRDLEAVLARFGEIRFVLDRVVADPEARELVVLYEGHVDGRRTRAAEAMRFDAEGRQIEGEALYGAPL